MSRRAAKAQQGKAGNPVIRGVLDSAYKLQKSGNLTQAEMLYHRALQGEPGNPFALYGLGTIAMARGGFGEAIPLLKRALANGYSAETVYTHLGIAQQTAGQPKDALATYRAGMALDPRNPRYPSNASVVLVQLGDPEAGLLEALRAVSLDPAFASAHLNAGSILDALGRHGEARAALETAVRLEPDNAEAKEALGRVLQKIVVGAEG